jgi:hypothetical protein
MRPRVPRACRRPGLPGRGPGRTLVRGTESDRVRRLGGPGSRFRVLAESIGRCRGTSRSGGTRSWGQRDERRGGAANRRQGRDAGVAVPCFRRALWGDGYSFGADAHGHRAGRRRIRAACGALMVACGTARASCASAPVVVPLPTFAPSASAPTSAPAPVAEPGHRLPADCEQLAGHDELAGLFGLPMDSVAVRTVQGAGPGGRPRGADDLHLHGVRAGRAPAARRRPADDRRRVPRRRSRA